MTPKNKLFIGILAFMLIVNLLVIFNLNYFYIRAILAFIFLITIPGLLIMLCLKIRNINFWEYLVYTVGLSITFIMFAGLAVNWILPFLNITDKPLSLYPILICFDTILLILWLIAHKRNEDNTHILIFPFEEYKLKGKKTFKFIPKFPSLSWIDRIFIIIPFFFPFMAVIGAFLLNNHGTNIVTMIMLGGIATYVFMIVLFRDKLNKNVFPWALWMISISILLASSLRGWSINAMDTNLEYSIFKVAESNGLWTTQGIPSTFNYMLSTAILPSIMNIFCKINAYYIYKLFFILIFSIIGIIIYQISIKYINSILSFLAVFFFISQPTFVNYWSIPARQQIAFIFFGLMFFVLFSKEINPKTRNLLFVIFGFSMIVSHYSTSYIALAIFLFAYICIFFYKRYENYKIRKEKIKPSKKQEFYLTGVLVLLLLVFGFLWYSQVTPTANGLIDFAHKSISNMGNMFSEDVQSEGNSIIDNLHIAKNINYNQLLKTYLNETHVSNNSEISNGVDPLSLKEVVIKNSPGIPINKNISYAILFRGLITILSKLFFIFGALIFIFKNFREKILFFSIFFIFLMLNILPFLSIDYDLVRTYQQFLIIASFFFIIGIFAIFSKVFKKASLYFLVVFLLLYFFLMPLFAFQIFGGSDLSIDLNYKGNDYSRYYLHQSEISSARWILSERQNYHIYLASSAKSRLFTVSNPKEINNIIIPNILLPIRIKNSYVYTTYSNKVWNIVYQVYQANPLSFNFPSNFFNENKNLIYNNGGSEIFK